MKYDLDMTVRQLNEDAGACAIFDRWCSWATLAPRRQKR